MKLKTRVIISFFSIFCIPVILICVMFHIGMQVKMERIGEKYGIDEPTYENLVNNTLMLNKITENDAQELHDTIKEGDFMQFTDNDLGIEGSVTIDQLTIKEEDGKIPTYEVTLREDKSVGTIQKIQNKISSLESGSGGLLSAGGATSLQIQKLIESYGGKRFLSKLSEIGRAHV